MARRRADRRTGGAGGQGRSAPLRHDPANRPSDRGAAEDRCPAGPRNRRPQRTLRHRSAHRTELPPAALACEAGALRPRRPAEPVPSAEQADAEPALADPARVAPGGARLRHRACSARAGRLAGSRSREAQHPLRHWPADRHESPPMALACEAGPLRPRRPADGLLPARDTAVQSSPCYLPQPKVDAPSSRLPRSVPMADGASCGFRRSVQGPCAIPVEASIFR
jgi:hypothetical protein